MAWTQTQLDAIEEAIANGVLTVHFSDSGGSRSRTYRSMSDLIAARNLIKSALDTESGNVRDRTSYVIHDKT